MADPFRKVQPGQRLNISSRAWNRVLDGTTRPNTPMGGGFIVPALPAIRGTMRWSGNGVPPSERPAFGQVWVVDIDSWNVDAPVDEFVEPEIPVPQEWDPTDAEKQLFRFAVPSGLPALANRLSEDGHTQPFAVCVDPARMEFTFSGFAWTRVRVLARSHNYARLPGLSSDSYEEETDARGCLDSAFFGPARIIGYLVDDGEVPRISRGIGQIDSPGFRYLWALIKF
jgi:hypothetical protein